MTQVRVERNGFVLRLYATKELLYHDAAVCEHTVDEIKEFGGGFCYRNGLDWWDVQTRIPLSAVSDKREIF